MNSSNKLILCLVLVLSGGLLPGYAQTTNQTTTAGTNAPVRPRLREIVPANTNLPSLFLIGDSTVRNGTGRGDGGQWGWGDELAPFFDTGKINVVNRAVGGTTSRTFYRDLWTRVLAMIKPGDFVIMQFGTNGGEVNEAVMSPSARSRGEIHGIGDETQEITNIVTGKFEIVHTFGWYEKQMIADARAKGATAMVCSLIPRNSWQANGKATRYGTNSAAGWAHAAAQSVNAPFIDLDEIIARQYDQLGRDKVNDLFVAGAGPHTSLAGAQTNALCVVTGIKGLAENPLTVYLSEMGKAVTPADLSKPAPTPKIPATDNLKKE